MSRSSPASRCSSACRASTPRSTSPAATCSTFYLTGRDLVDGLDAARLRRMLRTYVQNTFRYQRQYIYDVLVHQYTDWERTLADARSRRDSLVELLADGLYVAPGVELAQRHAALGASATYVYLLHYPSRVTGTYSVDSL